MSKCRTQTNIDNCDFVKTVLMIFVVIGHSVNFWNETWFTVYKPIFESFPLKIISWLLNSFHIYAFTLTSGYIFAFLKIEKKKYDIFKDFFCKKIKRLLVPYIFVGIIWVIPIALYFYDYSINDIIQKYILGTSPNQLWFLLMLFWDFIFVWLITRLSNSIIINSIISILIYGVGYVGSHYFINYFCIWTACEYYVFFWTGYILFVYKKKIFSTYWWLCDSMFFLSFICYYFICPDTVIRSFVGIIMHLTGAVGAFLTLQYIATLLRGRRKGILKLREYSMPIYLFHQQIIYFVIAWLNGKVASWINAILNFIISFLGAYLISFIIKRNKIGCFLIGENSIGLKRTEKMT